MHHNGIENMKFFMKLGIFCTAIQTYINYNVFHNFFIQIILMSYSLFQNITFNFIKYYQINDFNCFKRGTFTPINDSKRLQVTWRGEMAKNLF